MSAWSTKSDESCLDPPFCLPIEALRQMLAKWCEWQKLPISQREAASSNLLTMDARERQARSQFLLAACALAWHLEHNPGLISELADDP